MAAGTYVDLFVMDKSAGAKLVVLYGIDIEVLVGVNTPAIAVVNTASKFTASTLPEDLSC